MKRREAGDVLLALGILEDMVSGDTDGEELTYAEIWVCSSLDRVKKGSGMLWLWLWLWEEPKSWGN